MLLNGILLSVDICAIPSMLNILHLSSWLNIGYSNQHGQAKIGTMKLEYELLFFFNKKKNQLTKKIISHLWFEC